MQVQPQTAARAAAPLKCKPDGDPNLPDLVITSAEPSTYFPEPGDPVDFQVVVTNQGKTAAAPFNVDLSIDGEEQLKQRVRESLQPNASAKLDLGSLDIYIAPGGAVPVVILADSDHEVKESNKCNNTSEFTLWSPTPPNPNPIPPGPPPHP